MLMCEPLLPLVPALASNLLMTWYIMMEMENLKDPEESEGMRLDDVEDSEGMEEAEPRRDDWPGPKIIDEMNQDRGG